MLIFIKMMQTTSVETGRAAYDPVHIVTFLEEKFGTLIEGEQMREMATQ
jgi:hypothetical protein